MSARIYRCDKCAYQIGLNDIDDDLKPKVCPKPDCDGVLKYVGTVGTSI